MIIFSLTTISEFLFVLFLTLQPVFSQFNFLAQHYLPYPSAPSRLSLTAASSLRVLSRDLECDH